MVMAATLAQIEAIARAYLAMTGAKLVIGPTMWDDFNACGVDMTLFHLSGRIPVIEREAFQ
jgi:hypothetical protein